MNNDNIFNSPSKINNSLPNNNNNNNRKNLMRNNPPPIRATAKVNNPPKINNPSALFGDSGNSNENKSSLFD